MLGSPFINSYMLNTLAFPCYLVKKFLFPIDVHLARGNPIALAPTVLACLCKYLSFFKKTIVGLSKHPTGGDRFTMKITLQSPFLLGSNLGVGKVQKFTNVKLALDLLVDDFLWRPYVGYAGNRVKFYPNDWIWYHLRLIWMTKWCHLLHASRVSELMDLTLLNNIYHIELLCNLEWIKMFQVIFLG